MRACLSILLIVCYSVIQAQIVRGPYLQSPTPTSVKIKWRTAGAEPSLILYGTSLTQLTSVIGDTNTVTEHTVYIGGLQSSTRYYYAVCRQSDTLKGPDFYFTTFPAPGTSESFRVWAIGDFGKGNSKQQLVRTAYEGPVASVKPANLWIWLGDNVYPDGRDEEYQAYVFDSVWGYRNIMRNLPFMPSPGNHDYNVISPVTGSVNPPDQTGPYFDFADVPTQAEAGGLASGTELYYSYNYANVHFISLNSELGSLFVPAHDWIGINLLSSFNGSPMMTWLQQDLQANTLPWVVVYFHQPPFTDGSHESDAFWEVYMKAMRENFMPVLEQYGVDLVICGHSHVYERSYLMKGFFGSTTDFNSSYILQSGGGNDLSGGPYVKYTDGADANKGTVYVVNGNSGSSESGPSLQHPMMYAGYGCDTCVGSLFLDFNGLRVDGYHMDAYGVERDHFVIVKQASTGISTTGNGQILNNWSVSPNPFQSETVLKFTLVKESKVTIDLTDMQGKSRSVYVGNLKTGVHQITIDARQLGLKAGSYSLSVKTGNQNIARSILYIP